MSSKVKVEFKESATIDYTNPSATAAVVADQILDLGDRIGIADNAIVASGHGTVIVKGIVECAKDATLTIARGDRIYYDVANAVFTNIPTGLYAGVAVLAATSTAANVRFDLNQVVGGLSDTDLLIYDEDFLSMGAEDVTVTLTGATAGLTAAGVTVPMRNLKTVIVAGASVAAVADEHCGAIKMNIANTTEAEDAVLYMGDQLLFDIDKLKTFECRAKVVTPSSGVKVVLGMAGNHDLDKDTIAQSAWFSFDGAMACKCETDDGATDNDDVTAATLTTDTYYYFKIDFTTVTNIKFYIKTPGATTYTQVGTTTTYSMAGYTSGLQPYFSCDKASAAGTASLTIDRIRIVSERD